jgi:hypothetical protein
MMFYCMRRIAIRPFLVTAAMAVCPRLLRFQTEMVPAKFVMNYFLVTGFGFFLTACVLMPERVASWNRFLMPCIAEYGKAPNPMERVPVVTSLESRCTRIEYVANLPQWPTVEVRTRFATQGLAIVLFKVDTSTEEYYSRT